VNALIQFEVSNNQEVNVCLLSIDKQNYLDQVHISALNKCTSFIIEDWSLFRHMNTVCIFVYIYGSKSTKKDLLFSYGSYTSRTQHTYNDLKLILQYFKWKKVKGLALNCWLLISRLPIWLSLSVFMCYYAQVSHLISV